VVVGAAVVIDVVGAAVVVDVVGAAVVVDVVGAAVVVDVVGAAVVVDVVSAVCPKIVVVDALLDNVELVGETLVVVAGWVVGGTVGIGEVRGWLGVVTGADRLVISKPSLPRRAKTTLASMESSRARCSGMTDSASTSTSWTISCACIATSPNNSTTSTISVPFAAATTTIPLIAILSSPDNPYMMTSRRE
jgi:hypothetical protein